MKIFYEEPQSASECFKVVFEIACGLVGMAILLLCLLFSDVVFATPEDARCWTVINGVSTYICDDCVLKKGEVVCEGSCHPITLTAEAANDR